MVRNTRLLQNHGPLACWRSFIARKRVVNPGCLSSHGPDIKLRKGHRPWLSCLNPAVSSLRIYGSHLSVKGCHTSVSERILLLGNRA